MGLLIVYDCYYSKVCKLSIPRSITVYMHTYSKSEITKPVTDTYHPNTTYLISLAIVSSSHQCIAFPKHYYQNFTLSIKVRSSRTPTSNKTWSTKKNLSMKKTL